MTGPYQYPQVPHPPTAHPQAPYGRAPYGQAPYGQAPYGQAPYGQAPYGQAPYGQAPYGQGPWGPPPAYGPRVPTRTTPPWVIAVGIVAALAVLAVLVLAVGAAGGTARRGGTAQGGTAQGGGTTQTGSCPGGSLEGCYSEGQMQAFLNQAVTFVHGFSDDRYRGMPHPAGYQLITRSLQSPCGDLDAMSYAYCPADDRIYIGQRQLWQFYSVIGDAAAVVGLAHEYGHHIQTVARVPDDRSPAAQVRHENQADCIAGAFVGWAQEKGFLEDGDAGDISGLVRAISSSEDDPGRDHGTLAEREASLTTGIRDGLPGCSAFYPGTPVHQG